MNNDPADEPQTRPPAEKRRKDAKESKPRKAGSRPGGPMDVALLERLVALMAEHDLSTLDLKDGDQRIALTRGPAQAAQAVAPAPAAPAPAPTPQPAPAAAPSPAPDAGGMAGLREIVSPMVGTFYAAPNPDAAPFVKIGDRVEATTDVCVIEAMKVFNTIQADAAGTVEKVLVSNGDPVEYGQALFLVRPDGGS